MSILKVARMGHPVLRAKARTVDKSEIKNPTIQQFIDSMIDTMYEYSGVGLAAPQVHESLRVFVAMLDADGRGEGDAIAFINPEITIIGDQKVDGWEGCLSIPGMRGVVPRHTQLRYQGFDQYGTAIDRTVSGFHARVVQHECDHLHGILYPMRIKDFRLFGFTDILFPGQAVVDD